MEAALARLTELELERHDDVDDEAIAAIRVPLATRLARYRQRLDVLQTAGPAKDVCWWAMARASSMTA